MIATKLFELRDRATFIPIMATATDELDKHLNEQDRYLLSRAGYGAGNALVILGKLDATNATFEYDPYAWNDRTFHVAHKYIQEHWYSLESGQVIDVEFILGETTQPKESESLV